MTVSKASQRMSSMSPPPRIAIRILAVIVVAPVLLLLRHIKLQQFPIARAYFAQTPAIGQRLSRISPFNAQPLDALMRKKIPGSRNGISAVSFYSPASCRQHPVTFAVLASTGRAQLPPRSQAERIQDRSLRLWGLHVTPCVLHARRSQEIPGLRQLGGTWPLSPASRFFTAS